MKVRDLGKTQLGECYVYTKSKGRLYGGPLTKVGPLHYSEFGDFRVNMHWRTNDSAELRRLHQAVLRAIKQPGTAETFLEIRALLRSRPRTLPKSQIGKLVKDKSAQAFSEALSKQRADIELILSKLEKVS